jgi:hypothetical protein
MNEAKFAIPVSMVAMVVAMMMTLETVFQHKYLRHDDDIFFAYRPPLARSTIYFVYKHRHTRTRKLPFNPKPEREILIYKHGSDHMNDDRPAHTHVCEHKKKESMKMTLRPNTHFSLSLAAAAVCIFLIKTWHSGARDIA